jgi:hypothetical protein
VLALEGHPNRAPVVQRISASVAGQVASVAGQDEHIHLPTLDLRHLIHQR